MSIVFEVGQCGSACACSGEREGEKRGGRETRLFFLFFAFETSEIKEMEPGGNRQGIARSLGGREGGVCEWCCDLRKGVCGAVR